MKKQIDSHNRATEDFQRRIMDMHAMQTQKVEKLESKFIYEVATMDKKFDKIRAEMDENNKNIDKFHKTLGAYDEKLKKRFAKL